jgi:hypothetical protein
MNESAAQPGLRIAGVYDGRDKVRGPYFSPDHERIAHSPTSQSSTPPCRFERKSP